MTNSIFSKFNVFFCSLSILLACTQEKPQEQEKVSEIQASTADVKYVKVQNANQINPDWSTQNIAIVHTIGDPDGLHPCNDNSMMRRFIFDYCQRPLVAVNYELLELRPVLIKEMPTVSENQLEFTYQLKEGITWDDGTPLTTEDVLFTFKVVKCPLVNNPHMKPYTENLKDMIIDPDDPSKFTLIMKKTYVQNVAFLTDVYMMKKDYFDRGNALDNFTLQQFDDPNFLQKNDDELSNWADKFNSARYARNPEFMEGLGPYKIISWDPGQGIIIERKNDHWSKNSDSHYDRSFPEKIVFKENKDHNSQLLEFKSQALDVSVFLSVKTLQQLEGNNDFTANYHSRFVDTYNYTYVAMNTRPDGIVHKKIFTDKKVRRAIALLTPVDDMIAVLRDGKGARMIGPVSPLKEDYNHDLPLLLNDIELAKTLLDSAGWVDTDGDNIRDKIIDGEKTQFTFKLSFMTTQAEWKEVAIMMAESYYKAGIKAELHPQDFSIHYDNAKNHKFDMMLAAWAGSSLPEDFTQLWHTSSWASKGSNYPGFGTPESDNLIDTIKHIVDLKARVGFVRKLQEIIYDEQPYVFMWAGIRTVAIHKRFGNPNMYFERPGVLVCNMNLLAEGNALSNAP